ncbi:Uncharacterised protein [Bordetella pertussis]|nr:Uncharacterised protein [Bordetella pertussis]CPN81733.1 Uncharacterised protein [Bordetella pertussis]
MARRSSWVLSSRLQRMASPRSMPAENSFWLPLSTMHATEVSCCSSSAISVRRSTISWLSALRLPPRSMVTVATAPVFSSEMISFIAVFPL